MKNPLKLFIVLLLITCAAGCDLLGPSKENINAAMEAAMRGLQASSVKENMEIKNQYANAADFTFTKQDQTVIHDMSLTVNENNNANIVGECRFEDFVDTATDYTINGVFSYGLVYPNISNPRKFHGEMSWEMDYSGGKIDTLDFYLTVDEQGKVEEAYAIANGKEIDFTMEKKVHNFLKYLDPSVVN